MSSEALSPEEQARLDALDPALRALARRSWIVREECARVVRRGASAGEAVARSWVRLRGQYTFHTDHDGLDVAPRAEVAGLVALVDAIDAARAAAAQSMPPAAGDRHAR